MQEMKPKCPNIDVLQNIPMNTELPTKCTKTLKVMELKKVKK
jgi:hypothetical protein